jgi:hypothetical protein
VFGKFKSEQPSQSGKKPILGQGHGLSNEEGDMIKQMIRNEQHSSRELFIPQQDLAQEATTSMSPPTAQVVEASQIRPMLELFNRDFLYGQGRFDAYKDGLIFKWGDGYSRRHIWASVANGNLLLETSHAKKCNKPYCNGTHHVLTPDLYTNHALINQELGDLFRRPVYESPED